MLKIFDTIYRLFVKKPEYVIVVIGSNEKSMARFIKSKLIINITPLKLSNYAITTFNRDNFKVYHCCNVNGIDNNTV